MLLMCFAISTIMSLQVETFQAIYLSDSLVLGQCFLLLMIQRFDIHLTCLLQDSFAAHHSHKQIENEGQDLACSFIYMLIYLWTLVGI